MGGSAYATYQLKTLILNFSRKHRESVEQIQIFRNSRDNK